VIERNRATPRFRPARGLGNCHLQTIYATLLRRTPRLPLAREVWPTSDGDVLDLELLPHRASRPGVLVLHGLEGSSRSSYVRGVLAAAHAEGWNGAALNFRSCGPSRPTGSRSYHSGETSDLSLTIARLRERWLGAPLALCGFSLGANVVLKWLGEQGENASVHAAVAVSAPFDLRACADALDGPDFMARVYREHFLRSLRRKATRTARTHPGVLDRHRVRTVRTLRAYDDLVTAPLGGFADAEDYWARSSCARYLAAVRTPTLILSAEDDPIVPGACIPRHIISANPLLEACILPQGGHVGFVAGSALAPNYLGEGLVVDYLRRRFA
jgi:predicted alpha/beta-fold hydrolase